MTHSHRLGRTCSLLILAPFSSAWGGPPPLGSAEAVGRAVLEANPALESVRARIESLEHAAREAGAWKDPMLSAEYGNMPESTPYLGHNPMSGIQLKLEQTFPFPGKTGRRTAAAESRVQSERHDLDEQRDRLVAMTEELYYQLALVRQLRTVTVKHIGLVEQLVDVARVEYEVGSAQQYDLLRLAVLRDRLKDDLDDFGQREEELLAALNAALHRPAGSAVGTGAETRVSAPDRSLDALVARADAERPLLLELESRVRTEQLEGARAEREKLPDLTLWLAYRFREAVPGKDDGENMITGGVAVPLPWFWNGRRWGELARQREAARLSLVELRRDRLDAIRGDLEAALARWRRGYDKSRRYAEELVPAAQRTLDATLASYRVGRADFASLYQAELELLNFERTILGARTEAARARVEVARLTGSAASSLLEPGPTAPPEVEDGN
jgi:cobalt-zinc-cadmium efflux system outer membrane protein